METIWMYGLLLLLLAIGGYFYWQTHRMRRREEQWLSTIRQLVSAQEEKKEQRGDDEKTWMKERALLREYMEMLLEFKLKIVEIQTCPTAENRQFLQYWRELCGEGILLASWSWDRFYVAMDLMFEGFRARLMSRSPVLEEVEMQICCLMRMGFRIEGIAAVLKQSVATVRKRQTSIRKKLGLEERVNILEYLLAAV